jgi:hypothetical protein
MGDVGIEIEAIVTLKKNMMRPDQVRSIQSDLDPIFVIVNKSVIGVVVPDNRTRTRTT